MSRWSRLVPMVGAALLLAACSQDSDTPLSPAAARHDGGTTAIGSNSVDPGTSTSTGTSTSDTAEPDTTTRTGTTAIGSN